VANHPSALKRARQNERRRMRNRVAIGQMRTAIKKYRALVAEKKHEEAATSLSRIYKVIDQTRRKGVIHPNTAARYKSRLARMLAKLSNN
jgi:small subunit ribosomal protein S20